MKSKDARLQGGFNMKAYKVGGDTGISHYEILEDGVILKFHDRDDLYLYNYSRPGKTHVEQMIKYAKKDLELNSYVNRHVRDNYADKWIPDQMRPKVSA